MARIKWTYSYSNLGPKRVGGVTFYKVTIGSETRWLSRQGIDLLEKAHESGATMKTVRKAVTHYTEAGTRRRVKRMRTNIEADITDLLTGGAGGFEGTTKGIETMLQNAGLDDLEREFSALLDEMTEEEIREFYRWDKLLLQRFFSDSDVYRSEGSTEAQLEHANANVRRNAVRMRDDMLAIIRGHRTASELAEIRNPLVTRLLAAAVR